MSVTPNNVINFWFGTDSKNPMQNVGKWWKADPNYDQEIKQQFSEAHSMALNGELDHWLDTPVGTLAYILILDQFSRNIYRSSPVAYAQDSLALAAARTGIAKGFDKQLTVVQRIFFYIPFEHSECLEVQNESIALYTQLLSAGDASTKSLIQSSLDYANAHRDIIVKFGRYPHRNNILQRKSTTEEVEFLKQPNSSF